MPLYLGWFRRLCNNRKLTTNDLYIVSYMLLRGKRTHIYLTLHLTMFSMAYSCTHRNFNCNQQTVFILPAADGRAHSISYILGYFFSLLYCCYVDHVTRKIKILFSFISTFHIHRFRWSQFSYCAYRSICTQC